jgi:membrane-associated phospholipid phosphatase
LGDVGQRREVRVAGIRVSGRRRRPSGEKEPLPRDLKASGWFWLAVGVFLFGLWVSIFAWTESTSWWTDRDLALLQWLVDLRTTATTKGMEAFHALGSEWVNRPLRWGAVLVLIVFKRWRHLFAGIAAIAIAENVAEWLTWEVGRTRPLVTQIGDWHGYSHPSVAVAAFTVTLVVLGFSLIPRGKWRNRWFMGSGLAILLLVIARMYLGVDHPTDAATAALLGVSVPVLIFRLFVPDDVFPVSYSRGTTAHLDVSGRRREAIVTAVHDQLGIEVLELKPFGLEGSGGSTPLRLTVAGDPDSYLFAKLYAQSHLRSDRWYKLGRTIIYGSLEDEVRFVSVRRLVEYEDYMMLVMAKAGLPSAEPFGIVELTPEREYLIVTEFFDGSQEIGDAEINDTVIENALGIVRRLWDAGLAHRDIKPANLLVRGDEVFLIDTAFGTIRPSPWRQAVDLANMMIILGLRVEPQRVYDLAVHQFSPDDIAEAFAATKGITIPSQSQRWLQQERKDGRDILATFRELAPDREPIAIQRWSTRRIWLALGATTLAVVFGWFVVLNVFGKGIL